jgi:CHAT domain-containing protein
MILGHLNEGIMMRKINQLITFTIAFVLVATFSMAQTTTDNEELIPFLNKSLKYVKKGKCEKIDAKQLESYLDYFSNHRVLPQVDSLISLIARSQDTKGCKEGKNALLLQLFYGHTLFQRADFQNAYQSFDTIYKTVNTNYSDDLHLKVNVLHTYSILKKLLQQPDAYGYIVMTRKMYEELGETDKITSYIFDISSFIMRENPMMVLDMANYVDLINQDNDETDGGDLFVRIQMLKGQANLMIGNFQVSMQHYYKAYKKSLTIKDIGTDRLFETTSSMVRLYSHLNIMDSLQKTLPEMTSAYKNIEKPSMDQKGAYLGLISRSFLNRRMFDSALFYRNTLLDIQKKVLPANSHPIKSTYHSLSSIYATAGDFDKGLKYAHTVLQMEFPDATDTTSFENTPPLSENPAVNVNAVLQNLMLKIYCMEEIYKQTNELKWLELIAAHYKSMDFYVKKLQESVVEKNFLALMKINQNGYDNASIMLEDLYEKTNDPKFLEDLYYYSTALKGRLLAYQQYQLKLGEKELSLNQLKYQSAYVTINQLKAKLAATKNKSEIQHLNDSIFELHLQMSMLNRAIQYENVTSGNDFNVDQYHASISSLKEQLDGNTAIIEYVQQKNVLRVFVVTNDKMEYRPLVLDDSYDKALLNFRKALKTGREQENETLSTILIDPVKDYIADKKHLVIIPHDELFAIPFEALRIDSKKLIESHSVSYHYSGYFWLHSNMETRLKKQPSIALFAPVFDDKAKETIDSYVSFRGGDFADSTIVDRGSKGLQPLPFSKVEVDNISEDFLQKNLNVTAFVYNNATEAAFRSNINKDILHIATHGISNKKNPELSGLFFSQEDEVQLSDYTKDGFIHMHELYEMKSEADLAVLSACKSGVGKVFRGEGFFGLPRGFILAGTNNVIASLWKIHDKKTESLVNKFYDYLLAGNNYAESLRKAKLDMIKKGFLPMDWSGIILIGK